MAEPSRSSTTAGEKAGDKPGAPRRADPLHRVSESLRQAQALLEAAGLPRGFAKQRSRRVCPSDEAARLALSTVSTLLEILHVALHVATRRAFSYGRFQPFLRFWCGRHRILPIPTIRVSTLLEILEEHNDGY
jgi:hypothetical protein